MEVDSGEGSRLELDVLSLVNDARSTYGLRQQDYERYRHYCARKVHRVRKSTALQQGKRRFEKKPVTAAAVASDARALQILLFEAERAWAYAMELKADAADEPRKKHHLVKRLRRAADCANQLQLLCQQDTIDKRTLLEAQAYTARLNAFVHFERQQWQASLDQFAASRSIFSQLADAATTAAQATLCQAAIDEIDPNIRYCAYNLKAIKPGSGGQTQHDIASLLELRSKSQGQGQDLLAATIDALLAENRHIKASKTHSISWRGNDLQINNEQLIDKIIEIQDLSTSIEQMYQRQSFSETFIASMDEDELSLDERAVEAAMSEYDKIVGLGWDATKLAEKDVKEDAIATAKVKSSKSDEKTAMLQTVASFVAYTRLQHAFERGMLVLKATETRIDQQEALGGPAADGRAVRRNELVKLDVMLLQTLKEMRDLPVMATDVSLQHFVSSRLSVCNAQRLMHTADIYASDSKYGEALALLTKAREYVQAARSDLARANKPKKEYNAAIVSKDTERLDAVEQGIRGRIASTRAQQYLIGGAVPLSDAVGKLTMQDEKSHKQQDDEEAKDVSKQLATFFHYPRTSTAITVQHMPPSFQAIPVKAIFNDLAYAGIEFPVDAIARKAAAAASISTAAASTKGKKKGDETKEKRGEGRTARDGDRDVEMTDAGSGSGSGSGLLGVFGGLFGSKK